MTCNIGKTDKTVRIIAGTILVILGVVYNTWLGLIGLIPLLTAVFGICPLYIPFHINTAKKEGK